MSRYTGSVNRISRRLGFSILETNKEFSKGKKRNYAPGQHGQARKKLSGYGEQLKEKQKLAYMYGVKDRQFRRIFTMAKKMEGSNALNLLLLLESRLDNLVYRMGFAPTRRSARQLVTHGHILVNDKKNDIASFVVKVGDKISVKEKSRNLALVKKEGKPATPEFVEIAKGDNLSGKYVRLPKRDELNREINETYVVEWFNRLVK
ncbi:MAG: 30S ribosomal protein S4 [Mycoplasmataceae bacterium]|jgi:small subunit ribosomal protein S4|nr:30S ribosomal protein S4 [Mycoplasmataceae bacterium]